MTARIGVLVMAHGTPASAAEIEPFYTRIRRGRPPSPDQLADLVRRYDAIGGISPLAERTRAQVAGLAARLDAMAPGRYVVAYGAKHTEPSVEDAARRLASGEVGAIVGIVLTPHRSARGSGEYLTRAAEAVEAAHPETPFVAVEKWFDAPGFVELMADRVTGALARCPADPEVLFSAHSIPVIADSHDPYGDQVARSARLVAKKAGLEVPWSVAWQSAGRTDQEWLGPDLLATLDELGASGRGSAVVCPIGFVSDHLEVLYDLDIEARARAESAGLGFARTDSLNADPAFIEVLAGVVTAASPTS
ncbi:MAG: ferrochelatase [Acidimicrobiales bacterium]